MQKYHENMAVGMHTDVSCDWSIDNVIDGEIALCVAYL